MDASVDGAELWLWRALLGTVAACGLWFATQESANVAAALAVVAGTGSLFLLHERARVGTGAPLTIGVVFAGVVTVYGTYPLLIYLLLGGTYTPLNDSRLFSGQPDVQEVARIAWYYALYLGCFVLGYLLLNRGPAPQAKRILARPDRATIWALLSSFISMRVVTLAAEALFAAPAQDYLESYLKYRHLPLIAQQLLGHAEGITAILAIAVVVLACSDWRRYRWLVFGWFGLEIASLLAGLGSRTQLALLILAALIAYHHQHRRLTTTAIVGAAVAMLGGFLAIGALRSMQISGIVEIGVDVLTGASEFETLFANAYDIERMVAAGEVSPSAMALTVYFGDVLALIPQQLVPFEKLSLSRWYVESFYAEFAQSGGGLTFGAIAESILGTGALDVSWRAALTGILFGWLDRRAYGQSQSFWSFAFYAWLAVYCYQMFRVGTFALLPQTLYRLLPAVLMVAALTMLLRAAAVPARSPGDSRADVLRG